MQCKVYPAPSLCGEKHAQFLPRFYQQAVDLNGAAAAGQCFGLAKRVQMSMP